MRKQRVHSQLLMTVTPTRITCHRKMSKTDRKVRSVKGANLNKPKRFPSNKGLELKRTLIQKSIQSRISEAKSNYQTEMNILSKFENQMIQFMGTLVSIQVEYVSNKTRYHSVESIQST